jgi:U32 family peptidase
MEQVEILSPAGSFESLMAGIQGGTDAIYFGVDHLNMRARSADNFRLSDLEQIKSICQSYNVKCYLTLNTVLYDHDALIMSRIVDEAVKNGIDGIIASDPAVFEYCLGRKISLHISTQANISNYESVKFYSRWADVVVLARELTLTQVKQICEKIKADNLRGPSGQLVKVEIFVHGALCMAISGKCYLSLHAYNASANRGACMQNCRDKYTVQDESGNLLSVENEYIMSSKDLQTISILDQVLDTGVSVLKIEGRGKSPEYVKEVTSCYREALQAWKTGSFTDERKVDWMNRLSAVYNRGFWEGYYLGRKMGEWSEEPGSRSAKVKVYLGKGRNFYPKVNAGEFVMESGSLSLGDEILITGPSTGVLSIKVESLRLEGRDVESVSKGHVFSTWLPDKIRSSDKLYKLVDRKPVS